MRREAAEDVAKASMRDPRRGVEGLEPHNRHTPTYKQTTYKQPRYINKLHIYRYIYIYIALGGLLIYRWSPPISNPWPRRQKKTGGAESRKIVEHAS